MRRSFIHWYVAKVKYQTERKIKNFLEKEGIQHYIPFIEEKPVIPCLVFIRTDYAKALLLSSESGISITYLQDEKTRKFQVIPDKQMEFFIFLNSFADKTFILNNPENLSGGEKVRVVKGEFTGIEGELYRIKGHKRVVVRLNGLVSLATTYIPKENLEKL
ncbi:MAG: UpxY family transcription antiterminator [Dysgonamonadaceae bacterium]|jgi:transcription antitermination factor NusG|nr:UpxY family transcription antiterminator [Dysgonamonadaceae bacterium]